MFTLPDLPYPYSALEPYIDEETMKIHHDKHHAAYVQNLNDALKDFPELVGKEPGELIADLEAIPEGIRTKVRNHGGGHVNHSLFWSIMSPAKTGLKEGNLLESLNKTFGNFETFQEKFSASAMARFGSGWAWLVKTDTGLEILDTPNQDSPLSSGKAPILALDVWEHAYYLKYQNRRADYVKAWWNVVDWPQAERLFKS
jgi:Fe-Mn family superoxide dismutase